MADLKISQLNALAGASLASTDELAIVDGSASETKKITSADLVRYGYELLSSGVLDGDVIEAGTTSARGTIQLTDSTSSTSTTTAATPNAVKTAYDLADAALPKAGGTVSGNLIVSGDFTVNGTTTTIDTTTLVVEDKNIEIGVVGTPTDVTADGGGITLKGTTDKTITWVDATDAWTFSEHVNIASAKEYRIAGTKVLDATSLGSAVVSSSLTSVGTIGTGTWNGTTVGTGYGGTGQTTYTDGELLIGKTDGTLAKATITQGSGVTITNGDGSITISATGSGGTVTAVTGTSPIASTGGTTPDISIQDGTTAQKGAVQLEDSTSSTSTTTAATPNSVKSAYDLANAALPKSGGTMTGDITFSGTQTFPGALVSGDIGVTVQGYDVDTAKYDDATANFTGTLQNGGSNVVVDSDIGVTVQGYDVDTAKYDDTTANFTGTLQNGGSDVVVDSDIGVTVQAYDADTAKLDVAQTFTAVQTLTDPVIVGTILEDVYTITDGAAFEVDPGNGSVQLITLGANRTPLATNFAAGESVTLMVDDGSAYTLTWTDTTWGASGVVWVGGSAPTLETSGYTVIQFWKISSTIYGALVGGVA